MPRVSIMGCSGSGKSTLARALHLRTGLPWLELDSIHHQPDWKPLDTDLLDRLAASTGCMVTAEDHSIIGGLGGAVAEHLISSRPVPLERVGVQDRFGESAQAEEMLEMMGLTAPDVAAAAHRAIGRK